MAAGGTTRVVVAALACQRPDRRLEVRGGGHHRLGRDAVGGPALGGRHHQSGPPAARHAARAAPGRPPSSVRLQQGALLLELRGRHPAVLHGGRRVALRGRAETVASPPYRACVRQLHRALRGHRLRAGIDLRGGQRVQRPARRDEPRGRRSGPPRTRRCSRWCWKIWRRCSVSSLRSPASWLPTSWAGCRPMPWRRSPSAACWRAWRRS